MLNQLFAKGLVPPETQVLAFRGKRGKSTLGHDTDLRSCSYHHKTAHCNKE